jgi:hypothetical protein
MAQNIDWKLITELFKKIKAKRFERRFKWKRWKQGYRWNMWVQSYRFRVLIYLLAKLRGMTEAGYVKWLVRRDFEGLTEIERLKLNEMWRKFTEG